jgi:hypothetical protein
MNLSAKPAVPGEALRAKPGKAAYGKTVWSWHPLLVSSRRRCVDPTGFRQSFNPPATEAKRIRLRGEPGISRKAIAQGMPDALRCPVCSCASHHSLAHETAGAARTRHSLRPLYLRGAEFLSNLGRFAPRDRKIIFRGNYIHCKRSEAIHYHLARGRMLRGACHRARIRATVGSQ